MEHWKTAQYWNQNTNELEVYTNFEVSDKGNIRYSSNHSGKGIREGTTSPKIKTRDEMSGNGKGYLCINTIFNGSVSTRMIHRTVLSTFNPEGYFMEAQAAHKNDVPDDNRLENLYWATEAQNKADRVRNNAKA